MAALTEEMRQLAERFEIAVSDKVQAEANEQLFGKGTQQDMDEIMSEYDKARAELLTALSWVP